MSMFYNPCQNHSLLLAANAYGLIDCHWQSARSNMDHHCSGCRQSLTQAPAARRGGQVPRGCSSPWQATGQPELVQQFKSQDSMSELVTSACLYTSGGVASHVKNKLFSTTEGQNKLRGIKAWRWVCT